MEPIQVVSYPSVIDGKTILILIVINVLVWTWAKR